MGQNMTAEEFLGALKVRGFDPSFEERLSLDSDGGFTGQVSVRHMGTKFNTSFEYLPRRRQTHAEGMAAAFRELLRTLDRLWPERVPVVTDATKNWVPGRPTKPGLYCCNVDRLRGMRMWVGLDDQGRFDFGKMSHDFGPEDIQSHKGPYPLARAFTPGTTP